MKYIDLNSDVGESFGNYKIPQNYELMEMISSANLACGMHAGDPMIMDETVKIAVEKGIGIGAHPGYPDLQGFGRRRMVMTQAEVRNFILYQLGALDAFVKVHGGKLQHCSPHGALGFFAMRDMDTAEAIVQAVYDYDQDIIMDGISRDTCLYRAAKKRNMKIADRKFYVDRGYGEDGMTIPRGEEGAMITDEDFAIERAIKYIKTNKVITVTGKEVELAPPLTIMLHGDQPKAVTFARKLVDAFAQEDIYIKNFAEILKEEG